MKLKTILHSEDKPKIHEALFSLGVTSIDYATTLDAKKIVNLQISESADREALVDFCKKIFNDKYYKVRIISEDSHIFPLEQKR